MSRLVVSNGNIIEPTVENLQKLLSDGKYIICGDLQEKGNPESFILKDVFAKQGTVLAKRKIKWKNDLMSFCVSKYDRSTRFKLHFDSIILENELEIFIRGIVSIYDMFVIDSYNVDCGRVYGELGSRYENEIIFGRGDF